MRPFKALPLAAFIAMAIPGVPHAQATPVQFLSDTEGYARILLSEVMKSRVE